jgi:hypothetical protein
LIACTDGAFHYLKRMGFPLINWILFPEILILIPDLMKIFIRKNLSIRRIRIIPIFIKHWILLLKGGKDVDVLVEVEANRIIF